MRKNKLVLIYGIPCSGKSTLLQDLSTKLNAAVIKIDDYWSKYIVNPQYTEAESFSVFEFFLRDLEKTIKKNVFTIAEGVFVTKEKLNKIRNISIKHNIKFISILLSPELSVILKRQNMRNKESLKQISQDKIIWFENVLNSDVGSKKDCDLLICHEYYNVDNIIDMIEKL